MKHLIIIIAFFTAYFSYAEENHNHSENLVHFGVGNALSYNFNEKEIAYGLHLHFVMNFWNESGIGLGYESIFADNLHQALNVFYVTNLFSNINLNIGPGLTLPNNEHNTYNALIHIELFSEYHIYNFHVGPMIGVGIEPNESHIAVGVHLGY